MYGAAGTGKGESGGLKRGAIQIDAQA